MQVHLPGAVSSVYELWGGGPQGGLLTVLLFSLYSNWITDICQPGITQEGRFLMSGRVVFPRCSLAQQRDCPPDLLGEEPHVCGHRYKCTARMIPRWCAETKLNPSVEPFLPTSAVTRSLWSSPGINCFAAEFVSGVVAHVSTPLSLEPDPCIFIVLGSGKQRYISVPMGPSQESLFGMVVHAFSTNQRPLF